jgi:UDP:flavonoid glycosyltransferase YjiC (YdhE family)
MRKTVLLAPLDWGLGHTTRCIPIAKRLLENGARVLFAGDDSQRRYFDRFVTEAESLLLSGYDVTYSYTGSGFIPKVLIQVPKILRAIRVEHQWLEELTQSRQIDGIISDNRYGLWHSRIPSVILTHQLRVQTGMGHWGDSIFQRLHYRNLNKFQSCWVVDQPEAPGLSGILSHPRQLPRNSKYIGPLSQFEPGSGGMRKKHLLILLSGPEPQRSLLSELLWKQVQDLDEPVVFVEGKEKVGLRQATKPDIRWIAQTGGEELRQLLLESRLMVCRSGYSTLMDASVLGLRLVTIPTPGQTEQLYLGRLWEKAGKAACFRQEGFDLSAALRIADAYPYRQGARAVCNYAAVIDDWYKTI